MSIVAACPHCESRYNLNPDLAGKAMRCPNPDCGEAFTVAPITEPPVRAPVPAPAPVTVVERPAPVNTGGVADFVPVLEVESAFPTPALEVEKLDPINPFRFEQESAPNRVASPLKPAKLLPPVEPAPIRVVSSATADDGPKELDWRTSLDAPAVMTLPRPSAKPAAREDDELAAAIATRKLAQRRLNPRRVLYAILAGIVLLGVGTVVKIVWFNTKTEEKLAQEARDEYEKSNFSPAAEKYEQLLVRFPESESKPLYEFFQALSKVRGAVSAVTVADNPYPAVTGYREFLSAYRGTPFAKPEAGQYAHDVLEAGKQAVDALVACGNLRLKEFRGEGRQKAEGLDKADKAVTDARSLLPTVETFKEKETPPLESQHSGIAKAASEIAEERHRLEVLAPYRALPDDPSDERIVTFETLLKKEKLDKDEEAKGIVDRAKLALRDLVRPERQGIPAVAAPADGAASYVPLPAVDGPSVVPGSERKSTGKEVFFAQARGILTAFDAETGQPLWAARVAAGTANPYTLDLPARTTAGDGETEIVLVASDLGQSPGLTARDARTGAPLWHQPLEAPIAGRPVVVRRRVYTPLRDPAGTVAEFDLTDGTRLSQIQLRQPIGPGAALRPGTGLLYVAADARRVFVLDVEARNADGDRQPARCVQIIPTEHPNNSLHGPPVVVGPPGVGAVPRFLVVLQSDGPAGMKLRAYPVADPPKVVDPAAPIPELPVAPPAAELSVAGWATFAPESDGERCTLVTDRGVFAAFGVNQVANADAALFTVPVTFAPNVKPDAAVPGQVVLADEDAFWILAGGELVKVRQAVDAKEGWKLVPAGPGRPLGVPLHRPQVNGKRDLVLVTVRHPQSGACRAVSFDPRDGRVAWQRQLGSVPPAEPVTTAKSVLIVDEDGGAVLLDPRKPTDGTKPGPVDVALCAPVAQPAGAAAVAANEKAVWIVIPERADKDVEVFRMRQIVNGSLVVNTTVPLPARLSGTPLALGNALYLALSDGIVYRFSPGADKLTPGQSWKADGAGPDAQCFLAAGDGDSFFATDGNDRFRAWSWPAGTDGKMAPATGWWDAIGAVKLPPILAACKEATKRLIVADAGGLAAYAPDRTGEPVRKWRCGKELPAGTPTHGPVPIPGSDRVLYVIDNRHVVAIAPDAESPAWVSASDNPTESLLGLSTDGSRVYATNAAGQIRVLNADLGTPYADPVAPGIPAALPSPKGVALPFGPNRLLLTTIDGTAVVVFVP